MNILITGAAGFIGYNLSNILLEKKHKIYAIDNFDNYYSINIKKKRISLLKKNRNFLFHKVDITNKKITVIRIIFFTAFLQNFLFQLNF